MRGKFSATAYHWDSQKSMPLRNRSSATDGPTGAKQKSACNMIQDHTHGDANVSKTIEKKPAIVLAGMKGMVLNLLAGPCD
jgi:hypothetical protein